MDEYDEIGMLGGSPTHPAYSLYFSRCPGIFKMQEEAEQEFIANSNNNSAEDFKDTDIFPYVQLISAYDEIIPYKSYERLYYWEMPRPLLTAEEDRREPIVTWM